MRAEARVRVPKREAYRYVIGTQDLTGLVKEIRRQMALNQEDLVRQIAISYATVNPWERGSDEFRCLYV